MINDLYKLILSSMQTDILEAGCSQFDSSFKLESIRKYPFSRLYCFLDGYVKIEYNGKKCFLKPGFLYLIPSYAEIAWYNQNGFNTYWALFNASVLGGVDLYNCIKLPWLVEFENSDLILNCFEHLVRTLDGNSQKNTLESEGLLKVLLSPFLKAVSREKAFVSENDILRFKPVLAYIQKNLNRKIRIIDMASVISLEQKHFSKKFKEIFGQSPYAFVIQQRVRKAQQRLLQSDDTFEQIAEDCGFTDRFHLSKVFTRIAGIAPGAFRNREYIDE